MDILKTISQIKDPVLLQQVMAAAEKRRRTIFRRQFHRTVLAAQKMGQAIGFNIQVIENSKK